MASHVLLAGLVLVLRFDFGQFFNIDTTFPVLFNGEPGTYFGLSVELHRNQDGSMALITAPKSNYTSVQSEVSQPGILFKCNISTTVCEEVYLDKPGNSFHKYNSEFSYHEQKSDMMLGITLDVRPDEKSIVVCGHLWKNQIYDDAYFANGICYVTDGDFTRNSIYKLLPLIQKSKQTREVDFLLRNFYAYGLAGFSASYTEDGKNLILGAPGVIDGLGTAIDYNLDNIRIPVIPTTQLSETMPQDIYIGYSVTSGKFLEYGEISYVAGAPRCEEDLGCVFIYEPFERNKKFIIQIKLIGEKIGEYFGSCVLGVNVNNDKFTDLLVGAPFHSIQGDEGSVYVYISDGVGLQKQKKKLKGLKKPNARFGTAIANAGDLNLDGYIDVIIGAPYEDGVGAVYIYHGSETGIKPEFMQRITPESMNIALSGFGISISKGKDIDSNFYPDILIGAYDSNQAVLLRSRPIISVQPRMEFTTKQIKVNSTKCQVDEMQLSCFDFKYCLKYTGNYVPENVDIKLMLELDVSKSYSPRCYFLENNKQTTKSEPEESLSINTENCYNKKIYIMENIQDFITPIQFYLAYNVGEKSKFCKTCPIIDKYSPNSVIQEITFWKGCGEDNECLSNLKLQVSFANLRNDKSLIIGQYKVLSVEIQVENSGEASYQSIVYVKVPPMLGIVNQADCMAEGEESKNVTLLCNVGNPLPAKHSRSIELKFDISKLDNSMTELKFEFWVETASTDLDPSDNYVSISIPIVSKAAISIIGSAQNEIISLVADAPQELIPITHTYVVSKDFESPISLVDITLSIPITMPSSSIQFLELSTLHTEHGKINNVDGHCNISAIDFMDHEQINSGGRIHERDVSTRHYIFKDHPEHSNFDTVILDCSTAVCKKIRCVAGPFLDNRNTALFQIIAYVNLTNLQAAVGKRDVIIILSEGRVEVRDKDLSSNKLMDFTMVATALEKHGLHQQGTVPLWIIIVSVIAGILLLIILILLLVKFGFFRRKEQEEMERLTESGHLTRRDENSTEDERISLTDTRNT